VVQRRLSKIAAGLLFGIVLLNPGAARADERTEARGHFKRGMAAIADGRYDAGIEELKSAYEILPHPNVLYNIARAYVDMGDLDNAIVYYRKYLEGGPKDRDEVAQIIASLEERTRKQQAMLLETQQAQTPAGGPGTGPGGTGPGAGTLPGGTTGPGATGAPGLGGKLAGGPSPGSLKTEEVFEETVVTASKEAQSPLDAPSSTSIITEQDIRLSGIVQIPELLRRLAGVDIMEITGGQAEVSLRGFNQRLSNKVLVLIDGRSFYVDLLGSTIWATLPIGVEDIERIEVVRGPGSALYGADAFNGVVNIITKAPGKGPNGVNVGYGEHNNGHSSVWSTGRFGETAYRLSAGYDYVPRWSRSVPPGMVGVSTLVADQNVSAAGSRIMAEVTRHLVSDVNAGVFLGYNNGQTEVSSGLLNDDIILGQGTQLAAWVNAKHFELRSFWTNTLGRSGSDAVSLGQSNLPSQYNTNVVDVEGQVIEQFETGRGINHDLHVGANYRLKEVTWSYQISDKTENHFGLFVHDEVRMGRHFAVVGDYRADYVPYLARIVQSPRGSVLYHPSDKSTVRGIVATAFRTPNFLEAYLGFPAQLPIDGAAISGPVQRPIIQPEQILTTELGYLNSESDYFTFDSAFFYNHAKNLIELGPDRPVSVGDLKDPQLGAGVDPASATYPVLSGGYDNECQRYNVYGAELGVRTFPIEGLDVYGNYTLMKVDQDNSSCTPTQKSILSSPDARTSAHKINAGVQLRTKVGIDAEVDLHYVSPQDWSEQTSDVQKQTVVYVSTHLDAYTLLNARLGYRFLHNQAEISGVAFNLLDDRHREHPFGQLIDRRLMGFFTYRF
jgi:outer membrane receptor for ferrienterochelin and colicin